MKLDLQFSESGGQFSVNFGETSIIHDGQNGATFIPSVSTEGVISWTNDRDLPNPEPVNIKGEKGNDGTIFTPDETLSLKDGILSVNTAKEPDPDNTLPITSAAVASTVGNIEILLNTI